MSRPLRLEYPTALFHVTSRGNEQRDIFRDDDDRFAFLDDLGEAVARFGWIMLAYVLMSNHFHLVVELTRESLSDGMKWLNGKYARAFNRRHKRVGHLFQGRPDMPLVDKETYALNVLRYAVLNPVRARMVRRPEDYEWSSYRATAGIVAAPPWLCADNVLALFAANRASAVEEYCRYVAAGIGDDESPWTHLVGQVYLGTESWIEDIHARLNTKLRPVDHARVQREPVPRTMADVIRSVATEFETESSLVRTGHGGACRMIAAWLGRYEAHLTAESIGAALRVRSAGHVTNMIKRCDAELERDQKLRERIDRCTNRLYDLWKTVRPKL